MKHASCTTDFGKPLILQGVKALGSVEGRVLEMTLEQRYRNPLTVDVEVIYTFPLPHQAVLLGLEVEIGGERLMGVVRQREEARTKYEDAVSEGDTAVLVTVNPDRSYTIELGNLKPRESCLVRLRYAQVLQSCQGSLRLMLPVTLAPRYGDAVLQGRFEPHAAPLVDAQVEYPFDIHLKVRGELAYAQVASPSHQIATRHMPTGKPSDAPAIDIRLGHDDWLDRDLVLVFSELRQTSLGLAAMDKFESGTGVIMASLSPKLPHHDPLPVAVKILVDCSGSMHGDSIEAARRALNNIVDQLQEADRFSLSRFGDTVLHRCKALWKATASAKAAAHRWILNLDASLGGTEMETALLSTLRLSGTGSRTGNGVDVLLITDGSVHDIEGVLEATRHSAHRIFVVGIGSSPAEGLIRRLAEVTGGACEFVFAGEQAEAAILRMFHRMRSPAATKLQVHWPSGCEVLMATDAPLSAFDGDHITLYARVRCSSPAALQAAVRLEASLLPEGPVEVAQVSAHVIADETNTLARLAVAEHDLQIRNGKGELSQAQTKALGAAAERYQIVTPETSLLLVKERAPHEKAREMPELVRVPSMLAAGFGGRGSLAVASPLRTNARSSLDTSFSVIAVPSVWRTVNPASLGYRSSFAHLAEQPLDFNTLRQHLIHKQAMDGPGEKAVPHNWSAPKLKNAYWILQPKVALPDESSELGYQGLTPAGLVEGLRINPKGRWPRTYKDLDHICLGIAIIDWLELVIGANHDEALVVETFCEVMAQVHFTTRQLVSNVVGTLSLRRSDTNNPEREALRLAMADALNSVSAQQWPSELLDLQVFET